MFITLFLIAMMDLDKDLDYRIFKMTILRGVLHSLKNK